MQQLFSSFKNADPHRLHFAGHSHHPWPDCTAAAHEQYWTDSARHADLKWEKCVFPHVIPDLQRLIAARLSLSKPENIAFAPNTHEFVLRLLSCMPADRKPRILTTDSEFYSFDRQIKRLIEDDLINVTRVRVQPTNTTRERIEHEIKTAEDQNQPFDMIYISQVFFNSGYALPDLNGLIRSVKNNETYIVIDGYHGFMALETDLSAVQDRIFYLAGGYKYAMSGEGCCFIHVPDGYALRPRNTGWYAEFGALGDKKGETVIYGADGMRFWGATFDPSGLYRMRSVLHMLDIENISVKDIHNHVTALQDQFIKGLKNIDLTDVHPDQLLISDATQRGHFLTFETEKAGALQAMMQDHNIITDHRGNRLRFGFGIYQSHEDVDHLLARLSELLGGGKTKGQDLLEGDFAERA